MVLTLALVFKIFRPNIFSAVKNINFPKSKKFPTMKEIFLNQGTFPQSSKFSKIKKVFQTKVLLDQRSFPPARKFSTKKGFFLDEVNVS